MRATWQSATVTPPPQTTTRPSRIMRWIFRRDDDTLVCELGLNRDESAYELRIDPATNPIGVTTATFRDVLSAFERHDAIERLLIDAGWSLDRFDSGHVGQLPSPTSTPPTP